VNEQDGQPHRVAVIGAGAWGTTLASIVAPRHHTVLWAREESVATSVNQRRQNEQFLPGFTLAGALRATTELQEAVSGADLIVVAVPAQHVRSVAAGARAFVSPTAVIVSAAKGLELRSGMRMSEVLGEALPEHDPGAVGVLSGPNLAREIMDGQPAATCVAFPDVTVAEAVQRVLTTDRLRAYTSDDVVGCEVGGAVKNVIAIAAGVADGLGHGLNTKAALITRGLAEMTRLGVALGGRPLTFLGLAGNGDLIATCASPLSRNHRVGVELARRPQSESATGLGGAVAEGVATAPAVLQVAARLEVDMPICAAVVSLLQGEATPSEVVTSLMQRRPKLELHGLDETLDPPMRSS
jgi:glycerol-3-phosphate dehydrogenase (NAD(P)+)